MNIWRWLVIGSIALIPSAVAVQVVGPLLAQNNLSEIAAGGSSAQSAARTNLGIPGAAGPYLPLAGGTLTGPVIFGTGATLTANDAVALTPASGKSFAITPVTAGTVNNVVIGGSTPLAGTFTALTANNSLTANVSGNISLNATGTVALSPTGALTVNPVAASTINNASIGATTRGSGAFTTLDANSTVTLSPTGSVTINPSTTVTISPTTNLTMAPGGTASLNPTGTLTLKGGNTYTASGAVSLGATSSTVGAGTYYPGHSLIGVQTFCASGCTSTGGTYTATSGTNQVVIEVQAAGGGSGGCALTGAGAACVAGSGAGGSYGKALFTSGFSGITMTVGAAGTAGTAGNNAGGIGGTTSAGTLISCPGGTAGLGGAAVATAALQAMNFGVFAPAVCTFTGGTTMASIAGQSSGLPMANNSTNGAQFTGSGGNSAMGIGVAQGLANNVAQSSGFAGTGYGWGAGGAFSAASQAAIAGLAGGVSRIVVWEFN